MEIRFNLEPGKLYSEEWTLPQSLALVFGSQGVGSDP